MGKVFKTAAKIINRPMTKVFGKKFTQKWDFAGQSLGVYDDTKPIETAEVPSPMPNESPYLARDRTRRRAARAQGQQSTIRTGATGAPYTGAPSRLLGG